MLKKILPIMAVTLIMLGLIVVKFYPELKSLMTSDYEAYMTQDGTKSAEKNTSHKKITDSTEQSDFEHRDTTLPDTFPFKLTSREKLAKKHPDKFEIVKKMYYAWDNIRTIQGEFEWGWGKGYPGGDGFRRSKFNVDFLKEMNRSKHQVFTGGEVVWEENFLMRDGIAKSHNPERMVYYQEPITEDNKLSHLGLNNKFITQSEWFSLIYNNYPDWDYKIGEKFGIPVYQIEGTISEDRSESLAGPFTMTVGKETGVLLGLKCFGEGETAKMFIRVNDIKINQGIPEDVFQLDLTEAKEISKEDWNPYGLIDEEKTGGVDTSGE